MFDFSAFVMWLLGAIAVVGILEWVKGILSALNDKNWKSLGLGLALPVICFIVAFGKGGADFMWNAFGMWSIAQLCYSLIVQSVQNAFKDKAGNALASIAGALGTSETPKPQ